MLDLVRVRLMRVFAHPATDVVGQVLGHLARTRSRQFGSRDSRARGIELEVTRLSERSSSADTITSPGSTASSTT